MPTPHGAYGKERRDHTRVSGERDELRALRGRREGRGAQIPGVDSVDVNARTGRLVVRSSIPVDASAVLGAVDEAGYQAVLVA